TYSPRLISWNGQAFDLPVLHYRSLVNDLVAPRYWNMASSQSMDVEFGHIDLMEVLSGYRREATVPLDEFSAMLGLPGLPQMDASRIWDFFLDGELEEIRRYCRLEVANIYLLYLRFQHMRGALDVGELTQAEETAYAGMDSN